MDDSKIPLTSSEISGLWMSYMSDSIIAAEFKYYLNRVECEEAKTLLKHVSDLAKGHISELTNMLNAEKLPIPVGFTDNDVDVSAPRLFTDAFYLAYLSFMARVSMSNYTLTLNEAARSDMRAYFSKRIIEAIDIYNNAAELRLSKGIFIRPPQVEVAKKAEFVKSSSFITDLFGEKRPLLAREIGHIFSIIFGNILGRATSIGFGQVARQEKVSNHFFRGEDLASKQIRELTSIFMDEGIPIPSSSDSYVTDSTIAPFSDKLMMNHQMALCSSAISSLGVASSDSMRSDLQAKFNGFTSDILEYGKDNLDIMIENGWLEQPPQAIRHENLVGV